MIKDITKTDKNFECETVLKKDGICFYDIKKAPFEIYGLFEPASEGPFKRLPKEVAAATSEGVAGLSLHTAGGRVRFCSDSEFICIKAVMNSISLFPHMPASGAAGFDLFVDFEDGRESRYVRTFMPPWHTTDSGYESKLSLQGKKLRYFTINFPSYSGVSELFVGVSEGSVIGPGIKYADKAPIVYYGSSITQGGCASRSGNIYQNVICRKNNIDYINLGFSGNGRAEDAIVDYMASLDMSAFVSDYDHNAPSCEYLQKTHYRMYEKIRAAHPDIPYIMLSKSDLDSDYSANIDRREIVFESYCRARKNGDLNVYYIDGASVFRGEFQNMCTVDGCHPNDLGFALMAKAIGAELERAFTQNSL